MNSHSHSHNHEEHIKSSDFLTDIVIGMSDGLTVPFALTAGLTGAITSTAIITTAGLAEIVAGSIAMGLGGYLAGKTEIEHYDAELKREYWEAEHLPEKERQEVADVMIEYGVTTELANTVAVAISKDRDKWVDFMMRFELGLEEPDKRRATKSALNIGLAYVVGGLVPLLPYFFAGDVHTGLLYSSILTVISLFFFGYYKTKVIGNPPIIGALRMTITGVLAAGVAYLVANLITSG